MKNVCWQNRKHDTEMVGNKKLFTHNGIQHQVHYRHHLNVPLQLILVSIKGARRFDLSPQRVQYGTFQRHCQSLT